LVAAVEATGSSKQLDIALQLNLSSGWHTYWRTPGDAGFAPAIDWQGSKNLDTATVVWPAPRRLPSLGRLETLGYEDGVVLPVTVTLRELGTPLHLHAEVDYAACKEVCIPYHASLDLTLPAGLALPGPEAPLIAAAHANVPSDLATAQLRLLNVVFGPSEDGAELTTRLTSNGVPFNAPDLFIEGVANGSSGRPTVALAENGRTATLIVPIRGISAAALEGKTLRLTVVDGVRSAETDVIPVAGTIAPLPGDATRTVIVGLSLLGGLLLNLMPCVLPVLSLKLLALVRYGGAERQAARAGLLATVTGVISSFGVLAAVLILLKAAGAAIGWGIQFQQPWFLAGMALLTTLFAASLWGWLTLALPSQMAGAVASVRGPGRLGDAFLLGTFATLLAASCSAPFVGTAIGFALVRGPIDIALVFGALGLGMASPFLAVAAAPGLVAWLPRPGQWMVRLQHLLGVLLLATAAWLLSVLETESGLTTALVAGGALAGLLMVLAARRRLPSWRSGTTALSIALAAMAVLVPALRGQGTPVETLAAGTATGLWRTFDHMGLHGMVARGQVVIVDVTASWCLTCKVNELNVLDRAPVADLLRSPSVVAMRADWTRPDPAVAAFLQSFGRYGVPLDVVYGPSAPEGILLPELLTREAVMDALRRAGVAGAQEPRQRAEN
jgi:suppressor for copper-sensitivity B